MKIIEFSLTTKHLWIRIFDHGFSLMINSTPLFSERMGHRKVYRFKNISFEILHKRIW